MPGSREMMEFTHLLVEAKSKYSSNLKPYSTSHDVLDVIDGFSHISFNYNLLPPIKIKTKPAIYILQRKEDVSNKRIRKNVKEFEASIHESVNKDTEDDVKSDEIEHNNSGTAASSEQPKEVVNSVIGDQHKIYANKGTAGVKQTIKNIIQQMNEMENVVLLEEESNIKEESVNEPSFQNTETISAMKDDLVDSNQDKNIRSLDMLSKLDISNISSSDYLTDNTDRKEDSISKIKPMQESVNYEKLDEETIDIAFESVKKQNISEFHVVAETILKEKVQVPKIMPNKNNDNLNSNSSQANNFTN